jgi:tungstate transport system ATP-binding protein
VRHALALCGVRGREARRRVDHALTSVGLEAMAGRPARVLSGGEQQRLALARAWALAPEVLFLDEPTASLDPPSTRAVEAIVSDIHALGTTIVMTTHHLAQAKRLADTIVLLHDGRVAEHTDAATFFRKPRSAEGRAFLEGERL